MEVNNVESQMHHWQVEDAKHFDYSPRALWLRAIVLGGLEGLVFSAVTMMGIGMLKEEDNKVKLITSFLGLASGAFNVAIAEFVSVYTQYDIMRFQLERNIRMGKGDQKAGLIPSPIVIAVAASVAYFVGGTVPVLGGGFIRESKWRSFIATIVASSCMIAVGTIGAGVGNSPVARSCVRVLFGGWVMISIGWGKNYILRYIGV
ncbi:vacuolar iron transporter homolog 4 [Ziziphus jujuba]|uniref:Vacuolar iron transporter n=1 Tax=Ziziphus jujuba TaxID=326968 RepID=A0A6P4A613_ZIZJJ|nr:vacuolar iron transporter homolog 4 [Ziziphus jujuba]